MQSKHGISPSVRRRGVDEAKFLAGWFRKPLVTGSIFPSSRALCAAMARPVPACALEPGQVVLELGPGTGVVTRALLERGVPEANLVLVEYSRDFCTLLRARHGAAAVVEGDAYRPGAALEHALAGRSVAAIVSSLPLMARPEDEREQALQGHLALMAPGAPFIQFTYALVPPVRPARIDATAECAAFVKRNLPPARVFVYRREIDADSRVPA